MPSQSTHPTQQDLGDRALSPVTGDSINAPSPAPQALSPRELRVEAVAAGAFLIAATVIALLMDSGRTLDWGVAALLFAGFVATSRIKFELGVGYTNATQLMFVPMLFLLPTEIVPLLVAGANLVGELPDYLRRERHPQRVLITLSDSWITIGPVLVLLLAGAEEPALSNWPIYLAALAAQFTGDFVCNALREWAAYGFSPKIQLEDTAWYLTVDALLSPLGLFLALTVVNGGEVFLMAIPLLGLFAIFAIQRRLALESARDLSEAYRGTTLLLADVIEHDDFYTGTHSRGVVSRSLQVADEMGLDGEQRRNVEFAALLHDVGKLAISKEIINKDGPLSSAEWTQMRRHTIEGERMLRKIGGLFDDVARVVRSSHERWDGTGYPDGLSGVSIPLEARIVTCCDAFDAMTTDRAYRRAMTPSQALDELRKHSGTQFDPGVAWTVIRLVEESESRQLNSMLAEPVATPSQSDPLAGGTPT